MGLILEPLPEMAPWRVELRSGCLTVYGGDLLVNREHGQDLHDGFAVRGDQAEALHIAIELAIDHYPPAYVGHTDRGEDRHWQARGRHDGWLHFNGPCYCYGATGQGWVPAAIEMADGCRVGMVEIPWDETVDLRDSLFIAVHGAGTSIPDGLETVRVEPTEQERQALAAVVGQLQPGEHRRPG